MEAPSGTCGGRAGSPRRSRGALAQERVEKGRRLWRRRWAMLGESKGAGDAGTGSTRRLYSSWGEHHPTRAVCLFETSLGLFSLEEMDRRLYCGVQLRGSEGK